MNQQVLAALKTALANGATSIVLDGQTDRNVAPGCEQTAMGCIAGCEQTAMGLIAGCEQTAMGTIAG